MSFSVSTSNCGGRWLGRDKRGRWQWGEELSRVKFETAEDAHEALDEIMRGVFGELKVFEEGA